MASDDEDTGRYSLPPFDETPTRKYKTPTLCPACTGEGRISIERESVGGYFMKECKMCHGTGVLR